MKNLRWILIAEPGARTGSIYTEKLFLQKSTVEVMVRKSIAFNVNAELAAHIVELHNSTLLQPDHDQQRHPPHRT